MIEHHTFKTPSGYSVVCKPHLTYGQSLEVSETALANGNPTTGAGFTVSNMHAANRKTMEFLLVSVTDPEGNLCPQPVAAVMDMPQADGGCVMDELDRLTNRSGGTKESGDPKAGTTP